MVAAIFSTFVEDNLIKHSMYVVQLPTTAISLDQRDPKSCFVQESHVWRGQGRLILYQVGPSIF